MTYNELSREVALLCSIEADVNDSLLLSATNLALRELYTGRVITRTVRMASKGLKPVLYYKQVNCANGGPFQVSIPGFAYSFRIQGSCQMLTATPDGSTLTSISTGSVAKTIKGVAVSGTSLRFFGTYTFTIYDFSVYRELFSRNAEDIPDPGETKIYDIRNIYEDYMSFLSPATDGSGKELDCCRLRDGILEIDSSYNGEIVLTYRRLPQLAAGIGSQELDVPEEYLLMFPLLVASYRLIKSNEALAKYYKSRYDDNMKQLDKGGYSAINTVYENINSWA